MHRIPIGFQINNFHTFWAVRNAGTTEKSENSENHILSYSKISSKVEEIKACDW